MLAIKTGPEDYQGERGVEMAPVTGFGILFFAPFKKKSLLYVRFWIKITI